MKKNIVLAAALSAFLLAKAQNYNAFEPQSVEIVTSGIAADDLFSYAKEWLIVSAKMEEYATMNKLRWERKKISGQYDIQTSYIAEDLNFKKVYGLLKYRHFGFTANDVVTFKLILSCEENKVILTMCSGYSERISEQGFSYPRKLENIDGDMEWEALKTSLSDFFGKLPEPSRSEIENLMSDV